MKRGAGERKVNRGNKLWPVWTAVVVIKCADVFVAMHSGGIDLSDGLRERRRERKDGSLAPC